MQDKKAAAYLQRHPEPLTKEIGLQTKEELLRIKEFWKTPTFAEFRMTIADWAKTPIYLITQGTSEAEALMKQLPVAVIKRLVFDCTDVDKDKELQDESEVDDYRSDLPGKIKSRGSNRVR